MILTRFSRVTFNAAHKYLGLTTEVLRTEKAINELACHPLPSSFYEGGGMHNLRSKFTPDRADDREQETEDDTVTNGSTIGLDSEDDYFGLDESRDSLWDVQTPGPFSRRSMSRDSSFSDHKAPNAPKSSTQSSGSAVPRVQSHSTIIAGDLHTTTDGTSSPLSFGRSGSKDPMTPAIPRSAITLKSPMRRAARLPLASTQSSIPSISGPHGDINLRDEVMACIAKSIGLIQPPLSNTPSLDSSPVMIPSDGRSGTSAASHTRRGLFPNSFSSLSFLDSADDAASTMTGASSSIMGAQPWATGLDNEVEILCFAAGTTLVRAGERNAGEYKLKPYEAIITYRIQAYSTS